MRRFRKGLSLFLAGTMILGSLMFSPGVSAASGWGSDSNGWFYYKTDGSYYWGQWADIGGSWYYFLDSGYMDYSEYRDGCWLESSGVWNTSYSGGQWKCNSTGWWYEDSSWYPTSQWLWIDGQCYYFGRDGYMEHDCFRDGCWLGSNGAWDSDFSGGEWKSNASGWFFECNGWYPANEGIWINGDYYWFNESGYYDSALSVQKKAEGADGRTSAGGTSTEKTSTGKSSTENGGSDADGKAKDGGDENASVISSYSYEVIPLLAPFNSWFYIKTDNPDPDSFSFIDKSSVYDGEAGGSITPTNIYFADVSYENKDTLRVKGGYIASGSKTDGGSLVVQERVKGNPINIYNITSGEIETEYEYTYKETDKTVEVPLVKSNADYLIDTYGDSNKSFFDNLSGIQSGFSSICLYNGVSVLGELKKSDGYYGISTSPHADQNFYIQDPYYRTDGKSMLMCALYPFRYDSLGFPSMMASIAKKLEPSSSYTWDSYNHYIVNVTYNGETHAYGGAGSGGGQPINENQIKYFFKFDGSNSDTVNNISLSYISEKNCEYGTMDVYRFEDEDPDKLTWKSIKSTVGTDGKYVKVLLLTSIFGGSSEGYTYIYDDESEYDGSNGFVSIGEMSNDWFEGRYYNNWEYYYPGVTFDEVVKTAQEDSSFYMPGLVFKDFEYSFGDFDYSKYEIDYSQSIDDYGYDSATGTWKGINRFSYDKETNSWISPIYYACYYEYDYDNGRIIDHYLREDPEIGASFADAFQITMEEAKAMNLDYNTNNDPAEYYIYDTNVAPGTYHKSGN
ncbi:MAG: hypothetical protein K6E10_10190 [Eubacterium sp.]|nr:hypothetical protein [Eubacterium sp.]